MLRFLTTSLGYLVAEPNEPMLRFLSDFHGERAITVSKPLARDRFAEICAFGPQIVVPSAHEGSNVALTVSG